jgi:hypothetical protein
MGGDATGVRKISVEVAKTWILDTDTKGTGAAMVPLEKALKDKRRRAQAPVFVQRPPSEERRPQPEPEPRPAHRFKVVDVATREVLADGADARATVDLLRTIRSVVDVSIWVWEPKLDRYRLLTFGERKALWRLREAAAPAP